MAQSEKNIMEIIGRKEEKALLQEAFDSNKAEFIALWGRRRVGKTYLIKNFFESKKCTFLYVSGLKDGALKQQLTNFSEAVEKALVPGFKTSPTWMEAFQLLTQLMENKKLFNKLVLFFDELPWLVTRKSQFLQALDYYWNRYWSHDPRIKLVVCGSAASWIIKNIIHNKGGLYNRITRQFRLNPFSLKEAKDYLKFTGIRLNDRQILEIYLVTGGIPYYLMHVRKGFSAAQNIDHMAFNKLGILYQDFDILFASLFEDAEVYKKLVRLIAKYRYGISQKEIFKQYKALSRGGRSVQKLKDLEEAGFLVSFSPYGTRKKGIYYRLIDEYTNFYLKWIEPTKLSSGQFNQTLWLRLRETPGFRAWAGYSFETLCLKHVSQLKAALKIDPSAAAYTWRKEGTPSEKGCQIDLLFDRNDHAITLCEIKYTDEPYLIDRDYFLTLLHKMERFEKVTQTKKQLFFAMISASGIKRNTYSKELLAEVVTLDALFK